MQRRAPTDPTQEKRKKSVEESIYRSIEIFRQIADDKIIPKCDDNSRN